MAFPEHRARRLRRTEALRQLTAQTRLSTSDFVYPIFVSETIDKPSPIQTMPGINNHTVESAAGEAANARDCGIPAVILFGTPATKDASGSSSLKNDGIVQQAIAAIKSACPEIAVIADVCLCEYTDHGHCGIISNDAVDNDATIDVLAQQAVSFARAGADMVAPSDMMDGRVAAIRSALDNESLSEIPIMSYAAKYCSAFYGPFREAAGSTPQFGDRAGYQMDPPNVREALAEIRFDIDEGADIVMVKPALAYLDIINTARQQSWLTAPLAAYNVSGEYAMVKLAAANGLADEKRLTLEVLTSIKRAGADIIITYHAMQAAEWLS